MNAEPIAYNDLPRLHVFSVHYIGPTNHRPSRVKITSLYWGTYKTMAYSYDHNSMEEQAAEWLKAQGYSLVGRSGSLRGDSLLFVDEFHAPGMKPSDR